MTTLLVFFGINLTCHYDNTLRNPRYIVGRERMYIIAETSNVQKETGLRKQQDISGKMKTVLGKWLNQSSGTGEDEAVRH
jgi:hypothetical protein